MRRPTHIQTAEELNAWRDQKAQERRRAHRMPNGTKAWETAECPYCGRHVSLGPKTGAYHKHYNGDVVCEGWGLIAGFKREAVSK